MKKIRNLENYLYNKYRINYAHNNYQEEEMLLDTIYKNNVVEWHYDYFVKFNNITIKLRKIVEENLDTNNYIINIYEI